MRVSLSQAMAMCASGLINFEMGNQCSREEIRREKIVIVGAGYAGLYLALHLQKADVSFAIINQSDVFHNNFASVRAIVQTGYAQETLIPLEKTFGGRFIQGKLTSIDSNKNTIVLDSGLNISYETLVIATGHFNGWPFKIGSFNMLDACQEYDKFAQKMKCATKVILVGGGPTGIETAAEMRAAHPSLDITLVHNSDIILSGRVSEEARMKTAEVLKDMSVELILGEKVENLSEVTEAKVLNGGKISVRTDKGRHMEADIVLDCTGTSSNVADQKYLGDSLDERGFIKVNEFLQVLGHENIFAIGDCNDVKERKLGYLAKLQAQLLGKSLENKICNGGDLLKYEPDGMPFEMMVTLGPDHGMTVMNDGSFSWNEGYVLIKQKTLLNDMFWNDVNQPMPAK